MSKNSIIQKQQAFLTQSQKALLKKTLTICLYDESQKAIMIGQKKHSDDIRVFHLETEDRYNNKDLSFSIYSDGHIQIIFEIKRDLQRNKNYCHQCIISQIKNDLPFSKNIWMCHVFFTYSRIHVTVKYYIYFQYMYNSIDITCLLTHLTFLRCFQVDEGIFFTLYFKVYICVICNIFT